MSAQLPPPDDVRTPIQYGHLTYSNPHGQIVHPRWANGEVVYSFPLGKVAVDAAKTTDEIVKPCRYPGRGSGRKMRVDAGDPRPKSGAWGWKPRRAGCAFGA